MGAGRREAKEALFTFHLEKEIYENDSIVHCFCLAGGNGRPFLIVVFPLTVSSIFELFFISLFYFLTKFGKLLGSRKV
jgi:hypothetical protein